MRLCALCSVLAFGFAIGGCASPYVVQATKLSDEAMTCGQIDIEMAEAERFRMAAQREKGVTGTNVAAVLFFWPAMIGTYANANEAIAAAEARKARLALIYSQKGCGAARQPSPSRVTQPRDSTDRFIELKSLLDKGLISVDDYNATRARLISEL